jgi:ankyrin repeat protein
MGYYCMKQLMSLLSSAIIEDIKVMYNAGLAHMAYFYFDFRDIHKQSLRDMISSFLFQLSTQSNHCQDILYNRYFEHNSGKRRPSDGTLTECLQDVLSLLSEVPMFIIMDAIDECPNTSGMPPPREEILDLVEQLVNLCLPNLRLCVTSRPDIQDVLDPLSSFSVSLCDEIGQKQDIANYIRDFIGSDQNTRRWRKEDKELVTNVLTEQADGMSEPHYVPIRLAHCLFSRFRLVLCQLEMLRRGLPPSVRRSLSELPKTLDETYDRILMGIKTPDRENARRLFQCLAVAIRPLRVEELAEVLAVDFDAGGGIPKFNENWRWADQERAVLSTCSSLVEVITVGDSQLVQFSHPSVKEFLTSDRLAESSGRVPSYHISLEPAHTILAQACLSALLRLEDHHDRNNIEKISLADYAAKHWVDHARFGNVASHIREGMELLFDPDKPHFANWVRIYDIDEPLGLPTPHPMRPKATPLYYAALCGFDSLAERLIVKHSMDVNARSGHSGTAIQAALYKRHPSIVWLLIEHGADVNSQDNDGSSPLLMALNSGNPAMIQLLIDHGMDLNVQDDNLSTALHIASGKGDLDIVRILLQYNAEVNPQDNDGSTPLHIALINGNIDIAKLLIVKGANVNVPGEKSLTPLHLAVFNEDFDLVDLLVQYDADVNARDKKGISPLRIALQQGAIDIAESLLAGGAEVNLKDQKSKTPLHVAVDEEEMAHIDFLLKHGGDPNLRDEYGTSPLHIASQKGAIDIAKSLLKGGAKVNLKDWKAKSPLHLAANKDMALFLIHRGADAFALDIDNNMPLQSGTINKNK